MREVARAVREEKKRQEAKENAAKAKAMKEQVHTYISILKGMIEHAAKNGCMSIPMQSVAEDKMDEKHMMQVADYFKRHGFVTQVRRAVKDNTDTLQTYITIVVSWK